MNLGISYTLIFLYLFFSNNLLYTQNSDIIAKNYGGSKDDEAYFIEKCEKNGFIIVGNSKSFGDIRKLYVLRLNDLLDTLWTTIIGFDTDYYGSYSICQTINNQFLLVGNNSIINLDSLGHIKWEKKQIFYGSFIQKIDLNYFIILGLVYNVKNGNDIYLIKIDSEGNGIWHNAYKIESFEKAKCVLKTQDNGFIINGNLKNGIFLMKLDSLGNQIWVKTYTNDESFFVYSICQVTDGGFFMCGYSSIDPYQQTAIIMKTDLDGNLLWQKYYYREASTTATYCQELNDNYTLVTGYAFDKISDYDSYIKVFNENGEEIFSKFIDDNCFTISESAIFYNFSFCILTGRQKDPQNKFRKDYDIFVNKIELKELLEYLSH